MIGEVSADDLRDNADELLEQVLSGSDGILITRDGSRVAALVSFRLFARIQRMGERFDALSQRIAEAYSDVSVEDGLAEIEAVLAERSPDIGAARSR